MFPGGWVSGRLLSEDISIELFFARATMKTLTQAKVEIV